MAAEAKQSKSRLSKAAKIHKRPLVRPALPSPFAGASQQKVVYVKAHTPFVPTIKRVRKLLDHAAGRAVQAALSTQPSAHLAGLGGGPADVSRVEREVSNAAVLAAAGKARDGSAEAVAVKATGKAIARALEVAVFFQRDPQYLVHLRTGTVEAVDDVEVPVEPVSAAGSEEEKADGDEGQWEMGSRVRALGFVEVLISAR